MKFAIFALHGLLATCVFGDITLLGVTEIPAETADISGLDGAMGSNLPRNRLGGMGSGICATGEPDVYYMISDRGPGDGGSAFPCRVHTVWLPVPAKKKPGEFAVRSTVMLRDGTGKELVGNSGAYELSGGGGLRFDPEAVVAVANESIYVSDEYGPRIGKFLKDGKLEKWLPIPSRFRIDTPDGISDLELPPRNMKGRQSNRGMEGLALSSDGTKLMGILQSPLIQDGGLDKKNKRCGENIRMLEVTLETGKSREFVYQLESARLGVNEILACGQDKYLVIERDGDGGTQAMDKHVMLIDVSRATDVTSIESLPRNGLPDGLKAVTKRPLIDLLEPRFKIAGDGLPEKLEGLAWGPTLSDGRRVLLVATDNDFKIDQPTYIWFFAIGESDLKSE